MAKSPTSRANPNFDLDSNPYLDWWPQTSYSISVPRFSLFPKLGSIVMLYGLGVRSKLVNTELGVPWWSGVRIKRFTTEIWVPLPS